MQGSIGDTLPALTDEEQGEACKLYAYLLVLKASDVRQALVTLDGENVSVRPTGRRVEVAKLSSRRLALGPAS